MTTSNLKPGDWVFFEDACVAGKVRKVWAPGTWKPSADVQETAAEVQPINAECVELEDGNVMLAFERDQPKFALCQEREAMFFKQAVALFSHAIKGAFPLAKAIGIDYGRARQFMLAALTAQLGGLMRPGG